MSDRAGWHRLLPPNDELGWTPYAWLIYLPVFFVQPMLRPTPVGEWLLFIGGAGLFLVSYFRGHWVRGRDLIGIVLFQLVLGVAFSPINFGAYVFFIYAALFSARLENTVAAVRWLALVTMVGLATALVLHAPLYYWLGHGVFTPLIGAANLHAARVRRANAKLRVAYDEIQHLAAVAERERIARDLHDVLGHTLSLIVLKAELASKLAEREPARAVKEIRDVEAVSRGALQEVRDAIRGYRPTLADELARARSILETARVEVTVETRLSAEELGSHRGIEDVLALALREAITNVVRHAGASHATVRVWRDDGNALLEVTDDGRGTERGDGGGDGAGLRGMRERVESVGGALTMTSDVGTRLVIRLPLAHAVTAQNAPSAT